MSFLVALTAERTHLMGEESSQREHGLVEGLLAQGNVDELQEVRPGVEMGHQRRLRTSQKRITWLPEGCPAGVSGVCQERST